MNCAIPMALLDLFNAAGRQLTFLCPQFIEAGVLFKFVLFSQALDSVALVLVV
jgi:hypothetical protein